MNHLVMVNNYVSRSLAVVFSLVLFAAAVAGGLFGPSSASADDSINTITVVTSQPVAPGATVQVTVNATAGSATAWGSTQWTINNGPGTPTTGCFNNADHAASSSAANETFNITAPATAETYDLVIVIHTGDACGSTTATSTSADSITVSPTITVTKVVVNDNGGTLVVANFSLFIDAGSVTSGVANIVTPGSYTVSETSQAGYAGTITGACAADGTVTITSSSNVTCTITNDDIAGSIVLRKVISGSGDDDDQFSGTVTDQTGFSTLSVNSAVTYPTVDAGNSTVAEFDPAGVGAGYIRLGYAIGTAGSCPSGPTTTDPIAAAVTLDTTTYVCIYNVVADVPTVTKSGAGYDAGTDTARWDIVINNSGGNAISRVIVIADGDVLDSVSGAGSCGGSFVNGSLNCTSTPGTLTVTIMRASVAPACTTFSESNTVVVTLDGTPLAGTTTGEVTVPGETPFCPSTFNVTKLFDTDGDGVVSSGDTPAAGWIITLTCDSTVVDQGATAADGNITLSVAGPGDGAPRDCVLSEGEDILVITLGYLVDGTGSLQPGPSMPFTAAGGEVVGVEFLNDPIVLTFPRDPDLNPLPPSPAVTPVPTQAPAPKVGPPAVTTETPTEEPAEQPTPIVADAGSGLASNGDGGSPIDRSIVLGTLLVLLSAILIASSRPRRQA